MRTVIISAALLTGATAMYLGLKPIPLKYHIDDAVRMVALALGSFCTSVAGRIVADSMQLNFDERDRLIPKIRWAFAYGILAGAYVFFHVLSMVGSGYVSWNAPLAIVIFSTGIYALVGLARYVRCWKSAAKETNATVKLAAVDTSKPGPDVPLKDGADEV